MQRMVRNLHSKKDYRKRLGPNAREIWDKMPLDTKHWCVKNFHELRGDRLLAEMITVVRAEVHSKALDKAIGYATYRDYIWPNQETCQSGCNAEESHTKNERTRF